MNEPTAGRSVTFAAAALLNMACYMRAVEPWWRVLLALRSRRILAHAIRVIMHRHSSSPEQAFDYIAGAAKHENTTVARVAASIMAGTDG